MADTIALDDNFHPVSSGVVPNNAQRTAGLHLTNLTGPDSNGNYYGDLVTSLSGSTAVIGHVIVDSGSITANAGTNLNTSLLALESGGNLAGIKTDADSIVTNTTGLATQATLASAKTDLDSISTNTANIPAKGTAVTASSMPVNIASDQTVPVEGIKLEVTGSATGTGVIFTQDVSNYREVGFQLAGTYSATFVAEGSNDNTNWVTLWGNQAATANPQIASMSSPGLYYVILPGRYFRLRCSIYASGTANITAEFFTVPISSWTSNVYVANTPQTNAAANTLGGSSDFHLISAASTNATLVKNSSGQIYGYDFGNNGASDAWVKFYNSSTAPTAGSGTPYRTVYVPKGGRAFTQSSVGLFLGTGIGFTITGGAADNDSTSVGAAQVTVEVDWK